MSWLYSRALVEAFSAENCSDGEPSVPSSAKSTPHLYLHSDKTTGTWIRFPSGMMCEPLTDDRGAELLTLYLAGFPAKTSAPRDVVQASPASEADSGPKWHELSMKYDPATSSWKTHQCLFDEDLPESSVTLPKWGMMRDGVLSERTTLALPTSGTESGLWPTPTTQDNPQIKGKDKRGTTLGGAVRMWPTPTVDDANNVTRNSGQYQSLTRKVQMFPTPRAGKTTNENEESWLKRNAEGKVSTPPLSLAVRMFPTPKSRDWKGKSQRGEHAPMDALPNMITGSLNPDWVELLMGWPLGWTDITQPCEPVIRPWDAHWEDGVPRVTTQPKNRVARLKAIGNGQVPAVAALAWEILTQEDNT